MKLLAQLAALPLLVDPVMGIEVEGDQIGKQLEHAGDFRRIQLARHRIDGAERSEERTVAQHDRHRDIALKAIDRWRMMTGIGRVLGDIVDDHRLPVIADFVADRRLDLQLAARLQPESQIVP